MFVFWSATALLPAGWAQNVRFTIANSRIDSVEVDTPCGPNDEMHQIMVNPLPAGVRLTAIFDSCHSGSALDLPYIYSTQGVLKEPNLAKEAGQGLLSIVSSSVILSSLLKLSPLFTLGFIFIIF